MRLSYVAVISYHMDNYSYWESFLERQIYIDLIFTVQKLYREFPMLNSDVIKEIETKLIEFYDRNSNTRIKPRTICAVLVYHYSHRLAVTMSHTCRVFEINIAWFRKKRRDYLNKLGLDFENDYFNQDEQEWRLFTINLPMGEKFEKKI